MSVTDFKAAKKWAKIPKNRQELILRNVFCSSCGVTIIVKYTLYDDIYGVLLKTSAKIYKSLRFPARHKFIICGIIYQLRSVSATGTWLITLFP